MIYLERYHDFPRYHRLYNYPFLFFNEGRSLEAHLARQVPFSG